jgi:hypothetical protein
MLHQCGLSALARANHCGHRIPLQRVPHIFLKSSFYVCIHDSAFPEDSTFAVEISGKNITCSLSAVNEGMSEIFHPLSAQVESFRLSLRWGCGIFLGVSPEGVEYCDL